MSNSDSKIVHEVLCPDKEQGKFNDLKIEIQRGYDSSAHGDGSVWSVDKFKNKIRSRDSIEKIVTISLLEESERYRSNF